MSLNEVLEQVRAYHCDLVEVTGGEPLVQKRECAELVEHLCNENYTVLVETSGSLDTSILDERAIRILDVKCPGSGESKRNFWANLERLGARDEIKFVISDRTDFDYALDVIKKYQLDKREPAVLISPVWGAVTWEDLAAWILEAGLRARMQLQMHKLIWGPEKQGV